jgi:hypothetical protein
LSWSLGGAAPSLTGCTLPVSSLASGAEITCNFSYTVPNSGAVAITVSTSSSTADPVSGNNSSSAGVSVILVSDVSTSSPWLVR